MQEIFVLTQIAFNVFGIAFFVVGTALAVKALAE